MTNVVTPPIESQHVATSLKIRRYEQRLIRTVSLARAARIGWLDFGHSKVLKVGNEHSYHPDFHDLTLTLHEHLTIDDKPQTISVGIRVRFSKEYDQARMLPTGHITVTIESDHARHNEKPLVVKEPKDGHMIATLSATVIELARHGFARHRR